VADQAFCGACKAPIQWAKMGSGKMNPLDVEQVPAEAKKGVIAFNPRTGAGSSVTVKNLADCAMWREKGATFHISHFATCPKAQRFKRA
jgi:hypothetical protein